MPAYLPGGTYYQTFIFEKGQSPVQITLNLQYENDMDSFLKNEADILSTLKEHTKQLAGTIVHELSPLCLIY